MSNVGQDNDHQSHDPYTRTHHGYNHASTASTLAGSFHNGSQYVVTHSVHRTEPPTINVGGDSHRSHQPQLQNFGHNVYPTPPQAIPAQAIPTYFSKPESEKTLDDLEPLPPGAKPEWPVHHLVRLAIQGSPEKKLRLSEIYDVLSAKYDYFRIHSNPWRNTVRHTLSNHTLFQKVPKPETLPGKGAFWVVDQNAIPGEKRPRKRGKKGTSTLTLDKSDDSDEPTSPETSTDHGPISSIPRHRFIEQGPGHRPATHDFGVAHNHESITYDNILSPTDANFYPLSTGLGNGDAQAHGQYPASESQPNSIPYGHTFSMSAGYQVTATQDIVPSTSPFPGDGPHQNHHLGMHHQKQHQQPHHLQPDFYGYYQSNSTTTPDHAVAYPGSQVSPMGQSNPPIASVFPTRVLTPSDATYVPPTGSVAWAGRIPQTSQYPSASSFSSYPSGFIPSLPQSDESDYTRRASAPHPSVATGRHGGHVPRQGSDSGPSGSVPSASRFNPYGYHPQSGRR